MGTGRRIEHYHPTSGRLNRGYSYGRDVNMYAETPPYNPNKGGMSVTSDAELSRMRAREEFYRQVDEAREAVMPMWDRYVQLRLTSTDAAELAAMREKLMSEIEANKVVVDATAGQDAQRYEFPLIKMDANAGLLTDQGYIGIYEKDGYRHTMYQLTALQRLNYPIFSWPLLKRYGDSPDQSEPFFIYNRDAAGRVKKRFIHALRASK